MAHTSEAFRLFSAARAQSQRARQFSKIEELVEALKSGGSLHWTSKRKHWGSPEVPLGPFVRLAIRGPGFRRRSLIVCWPRRNCPGPPEARSWNTSRKKLPAYMVAVGVNAVSSSRGCQSTTRDYARKLNPLSFRSTTPSAVRMARGDHM